MNDKRLIATCGMNCALCMAYQREKNKCNGCNGTGQKPNYCLQCKIKNCEELKTTRTGYCFECEQFPCSKVKRLDKRYRSKYGMSMVENLLMIKEKGMEKFLENEVVRWSCKDCGEIVCVHKNMCIKCGRKIREMTCI